MGEDGVGRGDETDAWRLQPCGLTGLARTRRAAARARHESHEFVAKSLRFSPHLSRPGTVRAYACCLSDAVDPSGGGRDGFSDRVHVVVVEHVPAGGPFTATTTARSEQRAL